MCSFIYPDRSDKSYIACAQWFSEPLNLEAITRSKENCNLAKQSYRPTPIWIYPLDQTRGLYDIKKENEPAVITHSVSHIVGESCADLN